MPFKMQIKITVVENGVPVKVWRDVRPTGGTAYQYDTRDEADSMLRICYGSAAETRVVES